MRVGRKFGEELYLPLMSQGLTSSTRLRLEPVTFQLFIKNSGYGAERKTGYG